MTNSERVDELLRIKDAIAELIGEAEGLLAGTPEWRSARSYWIGHLHGALERNSGGYCGGSMVTMADTIEALSCEGEDEEIAA